MLTSAWNTFILPSNGTAQDLHCFDSKSLVELLFLPSHLDVAFHCIKSNTLLLFAFNIFKVMEKEQDKHNENSIWKRAVYSCSLEHSVNHNLVAGNSEGFLTWWCSDFLCYIWLHLILLSRINSLVSPALSPHVLPPRITLLHCLSNETDIGYYDALSGVTQL